MIGLIIRRLITLILHCRSFLGVDVDFLHSLVIDNIKMKIKPKFKVKFQKQWNLSKIVNLSAGNVYFTITEKELKCLNSEHDLDTMVGMLIKAINLTI